MAAMPDPTGAGNLLDFPAFAERGGPPASPVAGPGIAHLPPDVRGRHIAPGFVARWLIVYLFTPAGAAERLQVDERAVMKWLRTNALRGYRIGQEWRIKGPDLEAFLAARANATPQTSSRADRVRPLAGALDGPPDRQPRLTLSDRDPWTRTGNRAAVRGDERS